jgi:YidC/Oxa1 family membrane protein insertase
MSIPLLDGLVAVGYPIVAGLSAFLDPVGGAAAAIVVCTAALRLLLLPLTMAAVRGERTRIALAPRIAELQRRYRRDPVELRNQAAALYRAAGVSPFAGVLPALLQTPFFVVWYRFFTLQDVAGQPNVLLTQRFLGAELSSHLFGGGSGPAFLPLLLALLVLAVLAARRSRRVSAVVGGPAPSGILLVLPFASLLGAVVMPLAAVLYLVTTMTWTAVENVALRRGLP